MIRDDQQVVGEGQPRVHAQQCVEGVAVRRQHTPSTGVAACDRPEVAPCAPKEHSHHDRAGEAHFREQLHEQRVCDLGSGQFASVLRALLQ